ncbi:MAG: T9SS C-terminal target domain-containing protein [Microscillaceae bacterium]|nr:T9SS C-terminal target domain-containing protein [Microscillaceae bacterium]
MKKLQILWLMLLGLTIGLSSCGDDDEVTVVEDPTITASAQTTSINQVLTFPVNIQAPGGFASATVSAANGAATISGLPSAGTTTSTAATVTYNAPANAVNDIVTVTVEDQAGNSTVATVQVTVSAKPIVDVFASAAGVGTTTWTADNIYVLRGFVFVNSGQTLTIQAGTVVKGQPGAGAGASALVVARGGRLIAEGTSSNPIIFTNLADDVEDPADQSISTRAAWGGLIILGNAFINHANQVTNIEGIPAEEPRGLYGQLVATGGALNQNDAHDGGILRYVSLRHGATNIGAGNEINGLTMGGVGTGTIVEFVETFAFDDDGFEWFGGTVNSRYLASVYNQDDAFDWDFGWRGQNQFWLVYQEPGFANSDRGIEADGAHSGNLTASIFSQPQIYNMTLIGQGSTGNSDNVIFFTEGSGTFIHNSIIGNFPFGIDATNAGTPAGQDRIADGALLFKNNIFFNIGSGNTLAGVSTRATGSTNAALQTMLEDNDNEAVTTVPVQGIAANAFNPLPAAGTLAFTKTRSALPGAAVNGFTYSMANYIGAFGDTNWLRGWTATDFYGLMP